MKRSIFETHQSYKDIFCDNDSRKKSVDEMRVLMKSMLDIDTIKDVFVKDEIMRMSHEIRKWDYLLKQKHAYYLSVHRILESMCNIESKKPMSIMNYLNCNLQKPKERDILYKEYMYLTNNTCSSVHQRQDSPVDFCQSCREDSMVLGKNNDMYVCLSCGFVINYLSELMDYGINNLHDSYMKSSIYERKNHLKQWLAQIQGKEYVDIPYFVIDILILEFGKQNITNLATLGVDNIKKALKKHSLSKYYENSFTILFMLNGIRPKIMSFDKEKTIIDLFMKIEEPFQKLKKTNRKNILRYSYILYKLCQLLDMDEFLPQLSLLKSRTKLIEQDAMWKKICIYLNWEFIQSI